MTAILFVYGCGFSCKEGEPVENALHNTKLALQRVLDLFPEREYYKLYLTGQNNFRDTAATILPYKGNRDKTHKPEHYAAIRDYMVNVWGAEIVDGKEADDAIGIAQYAKKDKSTVIVSIDKDLNQIPGYHYHPRKQQFYYVTLHEADTFFWKQMLTGDITDNIPGIKGIGDKKSDKIIEECKGCLISLEARVEELYQKQYGNSWQQAMTEIASLLRIHRTPS